MRQPWESLLSSWKKRRVKGCGGPCFTAAPEQQQVLLELFCRLFTRLHRLDWRLLVDHPESYPQDDPYHIIDAQLAEWRPYVLQSPLTGFVPVFHWLEENRAQVPCQQPVPVHLDFHPKNILVTPDYQAKVIDWTQVGVHDARMDLAWTLLLVECYEGLARRQWVQAEYERQMGAKAVQLDYYDVAAALKRLYGIVFSITAGAETMGMRPGAEETMRRQIPEMRTVYRRMLDVTGIHVPEVEKLLA